MKEAPLYQGWFGISAKAADTPNVSQIQSETCRGSPEALISIQAAHYTLYGFTIELFQWLAMKGRRPSKKVMGLTRSWRVPWLVEADLPGTDTHDPFEDYLNRGSTA